MAIPVSSALPAVAAIFLVAVLAVAPRAGAADGDLPDGVWAVARATLGGEPRAEGKILNSTWTFRDGELLIESSAGLRTRWGLALAPGSAPLAFRATPMDAPSERPVWMIASRNADELRLAFYDGLDQKPEDFGPRRKLVVLTLVPAPAATPLANPCDILRAADVERLLGGPTRPRQDPPRPALPGASCALERDDGTATVTLTLIGPPAGAAYVEAARREAEAGGRTRVEEAALGPGAFSVSRGWTVVTVAMKDGTAMLLRVEAPAREWAELRRFAERVRDRLHP